MESTFEGDSIMARLLVDKIESDNRTKTDIKKLSDDDRIKEIAMMISGNKLTPSSLLNAKELLQK